MDVADIGPTATVGGSLIEAQGAFQYKVSPFETNTKLTGRLTMQQICNDLATEQQELDAIVANLDEPGWKTMTPSEGWDIKEQIRHLAYFENRAILAASNPEAFKQWFEEMYLFNELG